MPIDPQQLLRRILLGEDSVLELKEVRIEGGRVVAPHRDGLADELAAFANARGGTCVLGVEDGTRRVVGFEPGDLDRVEQYAQAACHDLVDPPLLPHIERLWLPDETGAERAVLAVEIPRSLFVHRSPAGYLARSGSTRRPLRSEQLASIHGAKTRLRLFADRLELCSPGGLPNTLEPESLPYRQCARNETLASLLARCTVPESIPGLKTDRATFMDRRGEGVPIILARSRKLSGREPEYRVIDDSELWLTLYAAAIEE